MGTVLFDVDGTLVDSTYVHVMTWSRALAQVGHAVPSTRIHRAIGMSGDQLLPWLLGEATADAVREDVSRLRKKMFFETSLDLQRLPGSRELVQHCVERGLTVVLATSAEPDELEVLLTVLGLTVEVAAITDAGDVETSKPAPDLLHVAMQRVGAVPEQSVMIGDARWDAISAVRAGVLPVGVRSGGLAADELLAAGAAVVYEDPAALLAAFDSSPLAALG